MSRICDSETALKILQDHDMVKIVETKAACTTLESDEVLEQYGCPICLDILYSPLLHPACGNMFCAQCLGTIESCPICRGSFKDVPCVQAPKLVLNALKNMKVRCNACNAEMTRETFETHSCRTVSTVIQELLRHIDKIERENAEIRRNIEEFSEEFRTMTEHNEQLERENARLLREGGGIHPDIEEFTQDFQKMADRNETLERENARLRQEIQQLRSSPAAGQRSSSSSSSGFRRLFGGPPPPRAFSPPPSVHSPVDLGSDDDSGDYIALYPFYGEKPGDLVFDKGDVIHVTSKDIVWWVGTCNGKSGTFRSNFVRKF